MNTCFTYAGCLLYQLLLTICLVSTQLIIRYSTRLIVLAVLFAISRSPEFDTWHDLYEWYFPRVPAAVHVFQNMFFRLEFADDASTALNETIRALDVQALLKTKCENSMYPPGSRSKYIVSANAVEIVGIHGVDLFSPAHRLGLVVFGGASEAEVMLSEVNGDSQPVPLARRFGPSRSLAIAPRRMEGTHFMQP